MDVPLNTPVSIVLFVRVVELFSHTKVSVPVIDGKFNIPVIDSFIEPALPENTILYVGFIVTLLHCNIPVKVNHLLYLLNLMPHFL